MTPLLLLLLFTPFIYAQNVADILETLMPELHWGPDMVDYVEQWLQVADHLPGMQPLARRSWFDDDDLASEEDSASSITIADSKPGSEHDAYRNIRYAAVAYCLSPDTIASWSCGDHCDDPVTADTRVLTVYTDPISSMRFYTAITPHGIVVAFRGTLYPQSIFLDTNILLEKYKDHPKAPDQARVHAGFLMAYHAIAAKVRTSVVHAMTEYVKAYPHLAPHEPITVSITGHSLGGALSLLCAIDLDSYFLAIPVSTMVNRIRFQLYSAGEPRVGNLAFSKFAASLDRIQSMTRVTYNFDPVPRLPPRLLGYEHHGTELFVSGWYFGHNHETSSSTWQALKRWVRDTLGWHPQARFCGTRVDEDPSCIDAEPCSLFSFIFSLIRF